MRNPKQDGSRIYDCIPQAGKCPMQCNQCYFNRGYYRETPFVDDVPEDAVVRMNCGHDSNIERELVIETASRYKNVFFNTSIPRFDFPGPVVFTANPKEEVDWFRPKDTENIMFIRLRVSSTNLELIDQAVEAWHKVPIVLTFMSYYSYAPELIDNYEWKVRHVNSYWCPTPRFIDSVMERYSNNVFVCGKWCKDCGNCQSFYKEFMDANS